MTTDNVEEFKRLEAELWAERKRLVNRLAEIDKALSPRGKKSLSAKICAFVGENPQSSYPEIVRAMGATSGVVASRIQDLYSRDQLTRVGTVGNYRYSLATATKGTTP